VEDFYLHEGNFLAPSAPIFNFEVRLYDYERVLNFQKYGSEISNDAFPKMDSFFFANADPTEPGMMFHLNALPLLVHSLRPHNMSVDVVFLGVFCKHRLYANFL
jgi:hypothetical protein